MKHRIVHALQKYFLNPPIELALAAGLPMPGYALLETKGRKTGKPRRTPVGEGRIGNQFWLVAEHGMKAGYVRNIERDPHVRLKLRQGLRYHWHKGTAHLLTDDDPRERQRWLASRLPSSTGNARAVRMFGTQLLTVRIDLDSWSTRGCMRLIEGEALTREARIMSGIILITVPTIQYGGYFLLTSLMDKASGYMENPLRQNFFRAGHAHAGVIVILSLVCQMLADAAVLPTPLLWFVRIGVPLSAILISAGFFFSVLQPPPKPAERSP